MDTWFNYLFGTYSILLSIALDYGLVKSLNSGLFDDAIGISCCGYIACATVFAYIVGVDYILLREK